MTLPMFALDAEDSSDAWYTPGWVFDGLGLVFDLDVASPSFELPWIPARQRFTVADDGLAHPWWGLVWCNPPYSAPRQWCTRWAAHEGGGALLIRADLSTSGPLAAFTAATSIFVPAKRIQFVDGAGKPSGAANFSTVILGRGDRVDAALERLAASSGGTARRLT